MNEILENQVIKMRFSQKRINQLVNLTIFVLKSHKPEAINTLKDFLTVLPTQEHINQILITAIHEILETEPEKIYWLLNNSTYLQPEIDVKKVVNQKLKEKLFAWGFNPEHINFHKEINLDPDSILLKNEFSDNHRTAILIQFFLIQYIRDKLK